MCFQSGQKGHFQKISKVATQSCDLLSDNENLFRMTTGINPESLNILHVDNYSRVIAWFSFPQGNKIRGMVAMHFHLDNPFGLDMWAIQRPFHPLGLNILHASIPKIQPSLVIPQW